MYQSQYYFNLDIQVKLALSKTKPSINLGKQGPVLPPTSIKILHLTRPQHFITIFQTKTSNVTRKTNTTINIYFKMLFAKALYVALNKMRISTYPQRLHWIVEASPTQGQFRWQASLVLHASKLTKPTLSLCYPIKLLQMSTKIPSNLIVGILQWKCNSHELTMPLLIFCWLLPPQNTLNLSLLLIL